MTHEWNRTYHVESFDQVDSPAYLVHPWLRYPKFNHTSATDYAHGSLWDDHERGGFKMVEEHDANLDPRSVRKFCHFLGNSERNFWEIVEKLYDTDLFEKDFVGRWTLKK